MVTSGAMTGRLDRLDAAGLVRHQPAPAGRRGALVVLTPGGITLIGSDHRRARDQRAGRPGGPDLGRAGAARGAPGKLIAGLDGAAPTPPHGWADTAPAVAGTPAPAPTPRPPPLPVRAHRFPPRSRPGRGGAARPRRAQAAVRQALAAGRVGSATVARAGRSAHFRVLTPSGPARRVVAECGAARPSGRHLPPCAASSGAGRRRGIRGAGPPAG